jgi:hypothetical protein
LAPFKDKYKGSSHNLHLPKIKLATIVKTDKLFRIKKKKLSHSLATKYAEENDIYTHPSYPSI